MCPKPCLLRRVIDGDNGGKQICARRFSYSVTLIDLVLAV